MASFPVPKGVVDGVLDGLVLGGLILNMVVVNNKKEGEL